METDRINSYARNTRRQYRRVLDRLALNNPGLKAHQIESHHLEACLKDMRDGAGIAESRDLATTGGRRPGRGAAALNQDKSILKVFIKWCQDEGYMVGNPAASIKRTKQGQERRFEDWVLDQAQVDLIIKAAGERHPRDRMAICLGLYAGLRDSEICGLQWADVNVRTKVMDFYRFKQHTRSRLPISDQLLEELRTYHKWYQQTYGAIDPHWYVVPSRWASPVRDRGMSPKWRLIPHKKAYSLIKDVRALLAEIGMPYRPNQGVHVLRRTFAFMLLEATGDIRDVTVALGHKNQATTELYLFRNSEADRLTERYRSGVRLGHGGTATHTGDNVVDISTRRRQAG